GGVGRVAGNVGRVVEGSLLGGYQRLVLRRLQGDLRGWSDVGSGRRNAAERDVAAAGEVGNHALRGGALGVGHVPTRGGGRNKHRARGGAGAAQVVLRRADGAARARRHVGPHPVAPAILLRWWKPRPPLSPIAVEALLPQPP